MVSLASLWLPILIAAFVLFFVSAAIHMTPTWHKSDYPPLPDEDAFRAAVGPLAIPPGEYMVPRHRDMAEMKSPEMAMRRADGPNVLMTVMPNGPWSMTRNLSQWFAYLLIVSIFSANVAGRALTPAATSGEIFRFTGTTAFIAYSVALWQMSIWFHRSWSLTFKSVIDGLIYALITGAVFVWMWPR